MIGATSMTTRPRAALRRRAQRRDIKGERELAVAAEIGEMIGKDMAFASRNDFVAPLARQTGSGPAGSVSAKSPQSRTKTPRQGSRGPRARESAPAAAAIDSAERELLFRRNGCGDASFIGEEVDSLQHWLKFLHRVFPGRRAAAGGRAERGRIVGAG